MLIWKASSLNINLASLRYRCLIPLHYLELCGYKSCIYSNCDEIKFNKKLDVIIFVKSFKREDLDIAKKAHKLGVPIIIDICDNIFIEEYTTRIDNIPSENFKEMAKVASAIVTTGIVLENVIRAEIGESIPIFIIPDGNETLEDVKQAMNCIKWTRWIKIAIYRPTSFLLVLKSVFEVKFISLYKQFYPKIMQIYKKNISGIKVRLSRLRSQIEVNETTLTERKFNVSEKTLTSNAILPFTFFIKSKDIKQQVIDKSISSKLSKHSKLGNNLLIAKDVKRIIWFGHHGASYGNFGMLNILDIAEHLIKTSNEINFTLLVVSNNYEKYSKHILPLPFSTEYIDWDPINIYQHISQSDVTIVPNSKTPFSIGKSANRTVLSLSLGVPVVATKTPALKNFQNCIMCDEWEQGLRVYLTDHHLVNKHIEMAQSIIKQNYSGEAIATQWANVINRVTGKVV
ncbi:hypothetical protein [Nostoc sp.]|uniref:hypothetical protein n=1 Tax=Nostoc sp. TaxID=1180 RepID=UPI002FF47BF1